MRAVNFFFTRLICAIAAAIYGFGVQRATAILHGIVIAVIVWNKAVPVGPVTVTVTITIAIRAVSVTITVAVAIAVSISVWIADFVFKAFNTGGQDGQFFVVFEYYVKQQKHRGIVGQIDFARLGIETKGDDGGE
jgi:hypothetical protein